MRLPTVLTKFGFKIGDRVRFVDDVDPDEGVVFGQEGTICTFEGGEGDGVGVRWDKEWAVYHTCSNFCEREHGWYVPFHSIIVANELVDLGEIEHSELSLSDLF